MITDDYFKALLQRLAKNDKDAADFINFALNHYEKNKHIKSHEWKKPYRNKIDTIIGLKDED